MIRIEVEEYCHSCLDFSPDVKKPVRDISNNTWSDTIIQCEYHKRCSGIKRFLEIQMKNEAEAVG